MFFHRIGFYEVDVYMKRFGFNKRNVEMKFNLICKGLLLAAAPLITCQLNAAVITSGNAYYSGYIEAGFGGGYGSIEVNYNTQNNGANSLTTQYGTIIGNGSGAHGELSIIGDGSAGSASISSYGSYGVRTGMGGSANVQVLNGGVLQAFESSFWLGSDGGVAGAQGTSVVTVEGQGSQLVTTKSTNDGGRIRVGEGLSYSELNIENGGAARATSALGATDTSNDGSLWVGSSSASGSTAVVNVMDAGSVIEVSNYINLNPTYENVSAALNITEGGLVEVTGSSRWDTEMSVGNSTGDSTVLVSGVGSALIAEDTNIGSAKRIAGYTAMGVPVTSVDWENMADGEPVTDLLGNIIYNEAGEEVLGAVYSWVSNGVVYETLYPSTYLYDEEAIYALATGSIRVQDGAVLSGSTVDVSTNSANSGAYQNAESYLTVDQGGTVEADVTVNSGGVLNGNGGSVIGNVTIDGGRLAPGNSPGEMLINGDLSLLSGSLELEFSDADADFLEIMGDLYLSSAFNFDLLFDTSSDDLVINLDDFFDVSGDVFAEAGFTLEDNINVYGLSAWTIYFLGQEYSFTPTDIGDVAVSAPAGFGLLILSIGMVVFRRAVVKEQAGSIMPRTLLA